MKGLSVSDLHQEAVHKGAFEIAIWTQEMGHLLSLPDKELALSYKAYRYYELIRENLNEFIDVVFPITKALIAHSEWNKWLQAFVESSYRHSPLFRDISGNFIDFLRETKELNVLPAILDLMRWEHLEMLVSIDSAIVKPLHLEQKIINPTLKIEQFDYPVHLMVAHQQIMEPLSVVLIVWRTEDHVVKAQCPDEVALQLLLHLDEAADNEMHYEDMIKVLKNTPILCDKLKQFIEEGILL